MSINRKYNNADLYIANSNVQLKTIFTEVASAYNNVVVNNNDLNDQILLFLETITNASASLSNDISNSYNLLLDAISLAEKSNSGVSLFESNKLLDKSNIVVDKNTASIYLSKQIKDRAQISDVKYTTNGAIGNSVAKAYTINSNINSITSSQYIEFENFNHSLQVGIFINFINNYPVNGLKFKLLNNVAALPRVSRLSATLSTGEIVDIPTISTINPKLSSEDLSTDSYIFIQFDVQNITGLQIYFEQNTIELIDGLSRYSFGLSNLEAGFYESAQSGYATFGPYFLTSELLKIAYSALLANISDTSKVKMLFSHNQQQWFDMVNTNLVAENKILNINNISADTISTSEAVTKFYLRLSIESEDVKDKVTLANRSIIDTYDAGTVQTIQLNSNNTFQTVYESANISAGRKVKLPIVDTSTIDHSLIEYIKDRSGYVLDEADIDQDTENYVYSRLESANVEPSGKYTVLSRRGIIYQGATLYKATAPRFEVVRLVGKNVSSKTKRFVIQLKAEMQNGLYKLFIGNVVKSIDLTAGFVESTIATLFKCDADDTCYIVDPYGSSHALTKVTLNNQTYVSLIGQIFESQDQHHNIYPISKDESKFYIEGGNVVCGNSLNGEVFVGSIEIAKVQASINKYINGYCLETDDIKKGKSTTAMQNFAFLKRAKLKHCNIVRGSVSFNIENAFVNTMIKEVPFIDGKQEFVIEQRKVQSGNKDMNEIVLDGTFIDNGKITFYGSNSLFKTRVYSEEDLIEAGDWMIELDIINPPKIRLPEGIKTPKFTDTLIEYDIDSISGNKNGIYSVDYKDGFIYASAPIDSNIIVNYQYFNMLLEGEIARELDNDEYNANNDILTLKHVISGRLNIVYTEGRGEKGEYRESPILADINITTITSEYQV